MPLIHLKTKRLEYKFEITQKYNLIIGDSGKGKTTLIKTLKDLLDEPSAGTLDGYKQIKTSIDLRLEDLTNLTDYVFLIDEFSEILKLKDIASVMENSQNYFVIISRDETLGFKSISLDCVYEMHASGKFHELRQAYKIPEKMFAVDGIICEDSKSGYQFIKDRFGNLVSVDYAKSHLEDKTGGKSKFAEYLNSFKSDSHLCLVFDRSAIGYDYHKILNSIHQNKLNVCMIDWDSFEYYILQSPVFNKRVPEPMDMYESKEKLATFMLSELINYKKTSLTKCLKKDFCKKCIDSSCEYRHIESKDLLLYWKLDCLLNKNSSKVLSMNVF
ncbi:MAG: hypothetical protein HFH66_08175 [Lachnospiraceae bacterium]|nr:hypothetical protein [Lachnospiraceae bacterium]